MIRDDVFKAIVSILNKKAEHNPEDIEILELRGKFYAGLNKFKYLLPVTKKIAKFYFEDITKSNSVALCYHLTGNSDKALKILNKNLKRDPDNSDTISVKKAVLLEIKKGVVYS